MQIINKEEFKHLPIHTIRINIYYISNSLENIGLDAGRGPGLTEIYHGMLLIVQLFWSIGPPPPPPPPG